MIEIENLSFSYTKNDKALDNINLKIENGSWISIIGHNGSGKSTLSKLLVGLLEPTQGTIKIDGVLLSEKTAPELRKKIGIVFQNPDNQFVGVTVKYDIAFGLENKRVPREEMHKLVDEYAKKVGMYEYLDREPHNLSGGQKQRVAIAGILALNQEIVILDEATSMLDPEGTLETINLIKALKSDYNKTIITITHDLDLASLSDRIVVLKDGNIIADDKPINIFKNKKVLDDSNLLMPLALSIYNEALNYEEIANNKDLMECLWESSLME